MATRDEIADALAGLALFADLSTPQLTASPTRSRRRCSRRASASCARA